MPVIPPIKITAADAAGLHSTRLGNNPCDFLAPTPEAFRFIQRAVFEIGFRHPSDADVVAPSPPR